MAPIDNDSDKPQQYEVPSDRSESDWSSPGHTPPTDTNMPQTYGGGPPASRSSGDLSTEDIVAVVAAIIPGVGQMLLGQTVKGLVLLGLALITCSGLGLFSVASMVDAFLVARAKQVRQVGEWEFFPDFKDAFNL